MNVLCAIENAIYMESGSLKEENEMYKTPLRMEKGTLFLPEVPGMGSDVDEDYIRLYRVD